MTKMKKTARKNKFKGIARRDFLKIAGLIGLGLTLEEALSACGATPLETPTSVVIAETAQPTPTEIPPTPDQVLEQYRKLIEEKGNSYVRILSAKARAEGAPLEEKLKTFVNKLIAGRHIEQVTLDIYQSEEEAKAAGTSYSLGNINPYGAPYIAFFDEKTRRAGFIFDVWESDKPLIATKEDAWEIFSKELASNTEYANFVSEKTGTSAESLIPDDFHLTAETNRLADLVFTPTGEAFLGVNHLTQRWKFIDYLGGLVAVPVIAAQTAETPEKKPEGVALSDEELITELVNHSKETNTYPFGLTDEQEQAWFEELNGQCGEQISTFEVPNKLNSMLIYVSPDLYPNFATDFAQDIEPRPTDVGSASTKLSNGSFDNTFQVAKDFFDKHPDVKDKLRKEKWLQMKYDPAGKLMFKYQGEWQTIEGSENLPPEFWGRRIDKNNLSTSTDIFQMPNAKVADKVYGPEYKIDRGAVLVPMIMLPPPTQELERLLIPHPYEEKASMGLNNLYMLYVNEIIDENGNKHPIGNIVILSSKTGNGFSFFKNWGSNKVIEDHTAIIFRNGAFTAGKVADVVPQKNGVFFAMIDQWPKDEKDFSNGKSDQLKFNFIRNSSNLELLNGDEVNGPKMSLKNPKTLIVLPYNGAKVQILINIK